jgi:hypothetical protein
VVGLFVVPYSMCKKGPRRDEAIPTRMWAMRTREAVDMSFEVGFNLTSRVGRVESTPTRKVMFGGVFNDKT